MNRYFHPRFRRNIRRGGLITLLAVFGALPPALATTDDNLLAACDDPVSTPACRFYVAGFLDGALLTDAAIVDSLSDNDTSEFLQRAYRTRVGTLRAPLPATALAEFCLPEGLPVDDAADRVVEFIADERITAPSLQDAVYLTVKRLFPCDD